VDALRNSGAFRMSNARTVSRGFYVCVLPSEFLISFINKLLTTNHPVNVEIIGLCYDSLTKNNRETKPG
jgi:hypothetical protein